MTHIEPGSQLELLEKLPKEIAWLEDSGAFIILDHIEGVLSKQLHLRPGTPITYLGTCKVVRTNEKWGELCVKIHTFKYNNDEFFLETPKHVKLSSIFRTFTVQKDYSKKGNWKDVENAHSSLQAMVTKVNS